MRRGQEAQALAEHATELAKDLLDAKLALQRESEAAANLAAEVQREAENATALARQLEREADHVASLAEQLERESEHSSSLAEQLQREAERAASLEQKLENELGHAATLEQELARESGHAATLTEQLQREAELAARLAREMDRLAQSEQETHSQIEAALSESADRLSEVENAAALAHELRTPLNSVLGLTNLLLDTPLNSAQRELSEMTRSSALALLQLVNETFDGPKPAVPEGVREVTLEAVPFDMRHTIEDVAAMLAAKAQGKGIDLIVRCAPGMPERLIGDAGRIRQILTNLVDNAIKFTREGFVLVDAAGEEPEGGEAAISVEVEDTGIGIPPEQLEAIFDRYVQGAPSNSSAAGETAAESAERGVGLGLAISRELARRMGGTIAVRARWTTGRSSALRFACRWMRRRPLRRTRRASGACAC